MGIQQLCNSRCHMYVTVLVTFIRSTAVRGVRKGIVHDICSTRLKCTVPFLCTVQCTSIKLISPMGYKVLSVDVLYFPSVLTVLLNAYIAVLQPTFSMYLVLQTVHKYGRSTVHFVEKYVLFSGREQTPHPEVQQGRRIRQRRRKPASGASQMYLSPTSVPSLPL